MLRLHLIPIDHWPAKILAKTFKEDDLLEAISYLDLVLKEELTPGPEMFSLGISPLDYNKEELVAVQHRLMLALSYQGKAKENWRDSSEGNHVTRRN